MQWASGSQMGLRGLVCSPAVDANENVRLCVCFIDRCLSFFLGIVLSVLRYTNSDYPFGIFKLFFEQ